jgi:hypothetical protein
MTSMVGTDAAVARTAGAQLLRREYVREPARGRRG